MLIVSTTEMADVFDTGTATLGAGADRVIAEPTSFDGLTQVLTDFDPDEDVLGVNLPTSASAGLTMTSSYDAATNATILRFDAASAGAKDFVIRLEGLNATITPATVQLYTDEAAALAGTSYGTL